MPWLALCGLGCSASFPLCQGVAQASLGARSGLLPHARCGRDHRVCRRGGASVQDYAPGHHKRAFVPRTCKHIIHGKAVARCSKQPCARNMRLYADASFYQVDACGKHFTSPVAPFSPRHGSPTGFSSWIPNGQHNERRGHQGPNYLSYPSGT